MQRCCSKVKNILPDQAGLSGINSRGTILVQICLRRRLFGKHPSCFYKRLPLLARLLLKRIKSDYSTCHCNRNPERVLHQNLTVNDWLLFLLVGQSCQFFRVKSVVLWSRCRTRSVQETPKSAEPLILKVTTKASVQSRETRKLCLDDGICLDQG